MANKKQKQAAVAAYIAAGGFVTEYITRKWTTQAYIDQTTRLLTQAERDAAYYKQATARKTMEVARRAANAVLKDDGTGLMNNEPLDSLDDATLVRTKLLRSMREQFFSARSPAMWAALRELRPNLPSKKQLSLTFW